MYTPTSRSIHACNKSELLDLLDLSNVHYVHQCPVIFDQKRTKGDKIVLPCHTSGTRLLVQNIKHASLLVLHSKQLDC